MSIQWFPGHMNRARKEMAEVMPRTDVVVELCDARLPYSSENPMLHELRGVTPCLKVLTRADLADPSLTTQWLRHFENDAMPALCIDQTDSGSARTIRKALDTLFPDDSGRLKPRIAMVIGIPNVGKSTLINHLAERTIAKTGNEPAVTKRQQYIKLGERWVVRDTPGVLWPNVENVASGFRLAATGAIRDTAMDSSEVACALLDYLCAHYAAELAHRFGADLPVNDSVAALEHVGRQRGCLGGGGLVDFDRAARILLIEFRQGKLGRMTLETPAMQVAEKAIVAVARERRAAKVEARRAERREKRRTRARNK